MKFYSLLFISFLISGRSHSEIFFEEKLHDFSQPVIFLGEFKKEGLESITIERIQNTLTIRGSKSEVVFTGEKFFASKPQFSKGYIVIPIFKIIHGGSRYYAVLLCRQDPHLGFVGSLRHLNADGRDMIYNNKKFYITNFIGDFDFPNVKVEVSRFGGKQSDSTTWKASLNVNSKTTAP